MGGKRGTSSMEKESMETGRVKERKQINRECVKEGGESRRRGLIGGDACSGCPYVTPPLAPPHPEAERNV